MGDICGNSRWPLLRKLMLEMSRLLVGSGGGWASTDDTLDRARHRPKDHKWDETLRQRQLVQPNSVKNSSLPKKNGI